MNTYIIYFILCYKNTSSNSNELKQKLFKLNKKFLYVK